MKEIVPCLIESMINLFIPVSLPDVVHVVYMSLDVRKTDFVAFENNRRRPAWASAQADQRLCNLLTAKYDI